MTQLFTFSALRATFSVGVLAMAISAPAQAIVYDFYHTGGADAPGENFLVDVTEGSSASEVLFKFTNHLPAPTPEYSRSTIYRTYFDVGSHADLFSGISFNTALSVKTGFASVTPPDDHPFLEATLDSDYKFEATAACSELDCGVNNGDKYGDVAVFTTTLGAGKTFANVVNAMNEGVTSGTQATGLRLGIFVFYLNGGPPPNVGTIYDDGGFVTNSVVAVPEVETWAMMLAGLGLTGFMVRRRRV